MGTSSFNTPPFKKNNPHLKVFPKKNLWQPISKLSFHHIGDPKIPKKHTHHPVPIKSKDFRRDFWGGLSQKPSKKNKNIYIYVNIIYNIYIYYILRKKYIAMGPNSPARFGKITAPLTVRSPFVTSGLPTHCTNIGELVHGVHTSKACHGETMGIEGKPGRFSHISQM